MTLADKLTDLSKSYVSTTISKKQNTRQKNLEINVLKPLHDWLDSLYPSDEELKNMHLKLVNISIFYLHPVVIK